MRRIITSFALLALLLSGLFIHSSFWLLFIAGFSFGGAWEISAIHFREKLPALSIFVVIASVIFPINAYLNYMGIHNVPDSFLITAVFLLTPLIFIANGGTVEDFKLSVPFAIYSVLWVGYLMSFNIHLYFIRVDGYLYGIESILLFAYIVCGNDIGAYYIGSTFGKNKLSLTYSPKKTWEGLFGGLAIALVGALMCYFTFASRFGLFHTIALAVLIALAGVLGDLVESLFKRSSNVKDTGGILPGHGGIMDRADSVLFAAPAFYWYLNFLVAS